MASAQQKPKRERGTRNSARSNGKAFKKPSTKGKPSYNSCFGISVKRLLTLAGSEANLYMYIEDMYQSKAASRGWTPAQARQKAETWMTGYEAKRKRQAAAEALAVAEALV